MCFHLAISAVLSFSTAATIGQGPEIPAERLGTAFWQEPPEVISPYERSWYDYYPIVWEGPDAIKKVPAYYDGLRRMYVRCSLVAEQQEPLPATVGNMPFYATNLCNLLYIRNKGGGELRKQYVKNENRGRDLCIRAAKDRSATLEDPEVEASERASAAQVAKRCGKYRPINYDLRDEATYTTGSANPHDFDFHPLSMAGFRQWAKTKYGSLAGLNKEWQTDFGSWDVVFPLMTDEIQAREFGKMATCNLAPWADHREYNDDTFLAAVASYMQEVHKHDPGAPIGYSGTQMPSAYGGFDYWKVCNTITWCEYYDVCGSREIMRSFFPRRTPLVAVVPYSDVKGGLRRMWYQVLHGDTGGLVFPYNMKDPGYGKNVLLKEFGKSSELTKLGENLKEVFREARSGIPCLLMHATMMTEPIGILYSQPSIRADWMFEVKREGKTWPGRYSSIEIQLNHYAASREGYYKLLEDLGLQYACIASQQVEEGELIRRGIKLFIVPRGLALSRKEIGQLRTFVERGGVLVTDIMAGRMNQNCRVWSEQPGPMDELLGVVRGPFAFQEEKKAIAWKPKPVHYKGGFGYPLPTRIMKDFNGLKAGEIFDFQGFHEPGLKAGTAQALAIHTQGPALLQNKVGKGYVYTLNFTLPNYLSERAKGKIEQYTLAERRLMGALAKQAGIEPTLKVHKKGSAMHSAGLESFSYKIGAARLYAVHSNPTIRIQIDLSDAGPGLAGAAGQYTISFPGKGYVTEMRSRKRFGLTDKVQVRVTKDEPLIFAVLPYEVEGLKVDVGGGKIRDGKLPISVSVVADGALGDHVVHSELVKGGVAVPESVVNLPCVKGSYTGAIDMSFVSGKGPWKLRLIDVASGMSKEVAVAR